MFNTNFKGHTRREFNYKPRFYDEQKEALQKRIRLRQNGQAEESKDSEAINSHRERLSEAFSLAKTAKQKQEDHRQKLSAQLRRLTIILAFFLGLYWAANEYLPDMLNYLINDNEAERIEQLQPIRTDAEEDIDYANPIRHR